MTGIIRVPPAGAGEGREVPRRSDPAVRAVGDDVPARGDGLRRRAGRLARGSRRDGRAVFYYRASTSRRSTDSSWPGSTASANRVVSLMEISRGMDKWIWLVEAHLSRYPCEAAALRLRLAGVVSPSRETPSWLFPAPSRGQGVKSLCRGPSGGSRPPLPGDVGARELPQRGELPFVESRGEGGLD
jgi:hypothetical protein